MIAINGLTDYAVNAKPVYTLLKSLSFYRLQFAQSRPTPPGHPYAEMRNGIRSSSLLEKKLQVMLQLCDSWHADTRHDGAVG